MEELLELAALDKVNDNWLEYLILDNILINRDNMNLI